MEDLLACRVCLATSVNLYDMYKYRLKNLFEIFSGIQVSPADNYPQYLCSYCGSLLLKCAAFRDRCRRANDLMKNVERQSELLTTDQIHTIALLNNTELPLTISTPELTNTQEIQIKIEHLSDEIYKEEIDFSDEEPLANKVRKKKDSDIEIQSLDTNFSNFDDQTNFDERSEVESRTIDESSRTEVDNQSNMPSELSDVDEMSEVDEKSDNDQTDFDNNAVEECSCREIEVKCLTKEEQIKEVLDRKDSYNYINSFYKCEHCYKGFIQDTTYKNHMLRHDPSYGPERCEICNTWWPTLRNLKSHITTAHERKFICKLCNQVTKSSHRAKEHLKWHKGHKFICKICGATFAKSTSQLTHLRLQHPSKFCCEVCGESFLGEVGLNMHIKKSHRGCENANPETEFKCEVCSIYFKTMDALEIHKNAYENGVCDGSQNSCFQCGENVPTQDALKDHLKTHDAGVKCEECDRTFAHERSFSVHYQRVHLGIKLKQYKPRDKRKKAACVCEICGKKCVSNAALVYHQRTHTGEKPYQCIECPKKFSIFQRLQIHVRTHTGERPFKCTLCPKAFKHKAALNRHDRVHSGEKPYQCGHCGKTFSQSNSMKLHVRTVHLKLPAPYRARRDRNIECFMESSILN